MQILSNVVSLHTINSFYHKIDNFDIPQVNITRAYLFIWRVHCSYSKTNICTKLFLSDMYKCQFRWSKPQFSNSIK